mgnify:CR=1 FL=1|jgi:hypothetical protein
MGYFWIGIFVALMIGINLAFCSSFFRKNNESYDKIQNIR